MASKPHLHLSTTLKLAQLKTLTLKCGLQTSGTKPILIQRLHDEINRTPPVFKSPLRILSIDMGIRNLAYCVLDIPAKKGALPTLQSWYRLAVTPSTILSTASSLAPSRSADPFSPLPLSLAAYNLLRQRLLPYKPTHILIERQRFRSNGSKHILEWTVRVNMLEAMIYAVLGTLKAEGAWAGEVVGVASGKVGGFWVGEGEDGVKVGKEAGMDEGKGEQADGKRRLEKSRNSKLAKIRNKGRKMDLVRRWLESGDVVGLGNAKVEEMAKAYMGKWDTKPGAKKGPRSQVKEEEGEEKMGKLDDLADSLLQGMAWLNWEDNKRLVLTEGVDALLEQ